MDYRDLAGKYDKIVSIEMFKPLASDIGTLFATLSRVLAQGGRAALQSLPLVTGVSILPRPADFISYIFPGGMLPSLPVLEEPLAKAGLQISVKPGLQMIMQKRWIWPSSSAGHGPT